MGKKKSFVDRKKSATFRLVCRDSSLTDEYGHLPGGDRVFTRVDDGTNYVPGFTDDDPRSHFESNPIDSIFADADEVDSDVEVHISRQKSNPLPKSYGKQCPLPDHIRREIIELGFPDDGYNYLLHLREISSSGGGSSFAPNPKARVERMPPDVKAYDASKLQVHTREEDESDSTAFYAVSSSTFHIHRVQKVVDPEVAAHLEKSDESQFDSDFEELEEDFVIQANKSKEEDDVGVSSVELIEDKEEKYAHTIQSICAEDNSVTFSTKTSFCGALRPAAGDVLHGHLTESKNQRPPRLLDEQFELLALREYSDDDNDATDIHDYEVMGAGNMHAPEINNAMKEFLTNNLDFQDKYAVPADLRIQNTSERSSEKHNETIRRDFAVSHFEDMPADDVLRKCAEYAEMYGNESQEEKEFVLVDDSSGNEHEVWDCETIVSTYSNLDNHPAKISAPQKLCRKDTARCSLGASEMNGSLIYLRGRQQLPVDFLPQRESSSMVRKAAKPKSKTQSVKSQVSGCSKAQAIAGETLEQKKARKAAVKEEKREARRAKKEMKTFYRGESRHAQHVAAVTGPPAIHLA